MEALEDLPMRRFCSFVWWFATRNLDSEQEIEKFRADLWRPPVGVVATRGPWSAAAETAGFAALKAATTGRVTSSP